MYLLNRLGRLVSYHVEQNIIIIVNTIFLYCIVFQLQIWLYRQPQEGTEHEHVN